MKAGTKSSNKPQLKPNRVVVTTDTFSLHPINLSDLIKEYNEGLYSGYPNYLGKLNMKEKKKKKVNRLLEETECTSDSNQSDICIYTNMTGEINKTVTTGVSAFKEEKGGECFYCRHKYQHEGLGIQIRPTEKIRDVYYHVVRDRNLCRSECLLAYITDYIKMPEHEREQCLRWTKEMLMYAYGIEDFAIAPDFRLLKKNKGTEDYDKWISGTREYELIEGRIIVPSKLEFKVTDIR